MITFTLTEQQADQVLTALGHRPFLEVNGLINTLLQQAQAQQQANQQQQAEQKQAQAIPYGAAVGGAPLSNGQAHA
jgi:hypothetical protein